MFYPFNQKQKNAHLPPLLVFLFSFFFLSACASDPKKASPVVTQVGEIQKRLKALSGAYEKRDESAFFEKLDADSKWLDSVREDVTQDFRQFSEATLSFVIDRVEIKENISQTTLRWQGRWTIPSSSDPLTKRGEVIFSWIDRDDPKLTKIRGDSPFGKLSRAR